MMLTFFNQEKSHMVTSFSNGIQERKGPKFG